MRTRMLLALTGIVLTAFAPAPFAKPGRPSDLARLSGTWTVIRYHRGRDAVAQNSTAVLKVTVAGNRWSFFRMGPTGKMPTSAYDITLDPKKSLPWIDLVGVGNKFRLQGVYRWNRDQFVLAFHNYNVKDRPTEVEGSNPFVYYLTLQRDRDVQKGDEKK